MAGNVMEQPDLLMGVFEFIDDEVEKWKAKRAEDEKGEIMKQQMLNRMR